MQHQELINSQSVIDLISEKHKKMRNDLTSRVEEEFSGKISGMDIYLLSLSKLFSMSISEAARYMGITRQGAHKHAKKLKELGLIQLSDSDFNKREKLIVLTASGKDACEKIDKLKHNIEEELKAKIGEDALNQLKTLFRQDW